MFPMLYEQMKSILPEAYFRGEEVPQYFRLGGNPRDPLDELVASIRAIGGGANSCGYVDGEGVHFHLPDDDQCIKVDMSRDFVFVSQPALTGHNYPSTWQVLFFLQEPVQRMLLVWSYSAIILVKTEQTLALCRELDQLWSDERLLPLVMQTAASEEGRELGLVRLMSIYEHDMLGRSTEMWNFWATFHLHLLKMRLHLEVISLCKG